jgi:hypothetical protein
MKIIGGSRTTFIVEMTHDELANLCGYYSKHSDSFRMPDVGHEICVSAMFKQLYKLAEHKKTVEGIVKSLRDTANTLEPVVPFIETIAKKEG